MRKLKGCPKEMIFIGTTSLFGAFGLNYNSDDICETTSSNLCDQEMMVHMKRPFDPLIRGIGIAGDIVKQDDIVTPAKKFASAEVFETVAPHDIFKHRSSSTGLQSQSEEPKATGDDSQSEEPQATGFDQVFVPPKPSNDSQSEEPQATGVDQVFVPPKPNSSTVSDKQKKLCLDLQQHGIKTKVPAKTTSRFSPKSLAFGSFQQPTATKGMYHVTSKQDETKKKTTITTIISCSFVEKILQDIGVKNIITKNLFDFESRVSGTYVLNEADAGVRFTFIVNGFAHKAIQWTYSGPQTLKRLFKPDSFFCFELKDAYLCLYFSPLGRSQSTVVMSLREDESNKVRATGTFREPDSNKERFELFDKTFKDSNTFNDIQLELILSKQ